MAQFRLLQTLSSIPRGAVRRLMAAQGGYPRLFGQRRQLRFLRWLIVIVF
jgi:hypothetical protein